MEYDFKIKPLGETGLLVKFGDNINPDVHHKIQNLANYLEKNSFIGMQEYVISYTSLAVYYNPFIIRRNFTAYRDKSASQIVSQLLTKYIEETSQTTPLQPNVIKIPVCYGGEYGPDLDFVAKHNNLSVDEVIKIHTTPDYLVYMIGFCPGFPYLGGMDERIATPRRTTPRLSIPARSIGIAGNQTGGYPISTPGGWQIIGRTPIEMFNLDNQPSPSLLHAGDIVNFYAVSPEEYTSLLADTAIEDSKFVSSTIKEVVK